MIEALFCFINLLILYEIYKRGNYNLLKSYVIFFLIVSFSFIIITTNSNYVSSLIFIVADIILFKVLIISTMIENSHNHTPLLLINLSRRKSTIFISFIPALFALLYGIYCLQSPIHKESKNLYIHLIVLGVILLIKVIITALSKDGIYEFGFKFSDNTIIKWQNISSITLKDYTGSPYYKVILISDGSNFTFSISNTDKNNLLELLNNHEILFCN